MRDIRTDIREHGPLLFDGAMGTCFAALPGRADQRCQLAIEISARIAGEVAPHTDGLYLMTPFRRVALMTRLLNRLTV